MPTGLAKFTATMQSDRHRNAFRASLGITDLPRINLTSEFLFGKTKKQRVKTNSIFHNYEVCIRACDNGSLRLRRICSLGALGIGGGGARRTFCVHGDLDVPSLRRVALLARYLDAWIYFTGRPTVEWTSMPDPSRRVTIGATEWQWNTF